MTKALKPFWRYFGGKWRAVQRGMYPPPQHKTIVEPFAGAAGYALNFPRHDVVLVDCYHVVADIWKWLVDPETTPDVVRMIPLVDNVADLPWWVPQGARNLIGFSMNTGTSSPRNRLSSGGRKLREQGRKLYGWTLDMRERVASQVLHIKHWRIIHGQYDDAPDVEATWHIDSPYEGPGDGYVHSLRKEEYGPLAQWCRSRRGQVMVCERPGATWLPFRSIGSVKSGPRSAGQSREAVWP